MAAMTPLTLDLLVTRRCLMACRYCRMGRRPGPIPKRVWRRAVDLLLKETGPLELQLMGGEPLLEYDLVKEILSYASGQARIKGKALRAGVTTNGLLLTPERSRELAGLGCSVMLSLDGDHDVQSAQRPLKGGGAPPWKTLRRNLKGLLSSGAPSFVNLVVTPRSAGKLAKSVTFLMNEGVRSFQVATALGIPWNEKDLRVLERQFRLVCAKADSSKPPAEMFNRRSGVEPVLLSPQHVVDTDGRLSVGTSLVLEDLWPDLHETFKVGNISALKRLPGRRVGPANQLRLIRGIQMAAPARQVLLNNLAAGYRMKKFWEGLPEPQRPPKVLAGEPTARRHLLDRLKDLGVPSHDPFQGGFIGELYLMLTMDCNLRCRACTLWGVGGACRHAGYRKSISKAAPLNKFSALIDAVVPYRPQYVNFSGGEPLLSPLLMPLAAHAKKRGLSNILTTNGVFLERHIDQVVKNFDQVNISVACPPSMREELRMGPPGHYEAMVRGLKLLAGQRGRHPDHKPVIRLICEIFDSNSANLGEVVEYLEKQGVVFDEILFQHLIFNRPDVLAAQEKALRDEFGLPIGMWRGYGYPPKNMDFAAFDRALKGLRERYSQARFSIDLTGTKALRDYYQGRRKKLGEAYCDGPWTQIHVLPNGDVWTCPDFVLGNIVSDDFAEIWNGAKARELRRRVSQKLFPACRGCFLFYGKEQPLETGGVG